jgi:hypothetical protein
MKHCYKQIEFYIQKEIYTEALRKRHDIDHALVERISQKEMGWRQQNGFMRENLDVKRTSLKIQTSLKDLAIDGQYHQLNLATPEAAIYMWHLVHDSEQ